MKIQPSVHDRPFDPGMPERGADTCKECAAAKAVPAGIFTLDIK